jgi:hypothetical protein
LAGPFGRFWGLMVVVFSLEPGILFQLPSG